MVGGGFVAADHGVPDVRLYTTAIAWSASSA
jgi:hypothetical protein